MDEKCNIIIKVQSDFKDSSFQLECNEPIKYIAYSKQNADCKFLCCQKHSEIFLFKDWNFRKV